MDIPVYKISETFCPEYCTTTAPSPSYPLVEAKQGEDPDPCLWVRLSDVKHILQDNDFMQSPAGDICKVFAGVGTPSPTKPVIPDELPSLVNSLLKRFQTFANACGFMIEIVPTAFGALSIRYIPDPVIQVRKSAILKSLLLLTRYCYIVAFRFGFLSRPAVWPNISGCIFSEAWCRSIANARLTRTLQRPNGETKVVPTYEDTLEISDLVADHE
jgi:hypothetical protein